MKLIIAGGRTQHLSKVDVAELESICYCLSVDEIVSGNAKGVDQDGEDFARIHKLKLTIFPADWEKHGRLAGYFRNKQMAEYADALAVFPGGKGSEMMFNLATDKGLNVYDYRRNK